MENARPNKRSQGGTTRHPIPTRFWIAESIGTAQNAKKIADHSARIRNENDLETVLARRIYRASRREVERLLRAYRRTAPTIPIPTINTRPRTPARSRQVRARSRRSP